MKLVIDMKADLLMNGFLPIMKVTMQIPFIVVQIVTIANILNNTLNYRSTVAIEDHIGKSSPTVNS